jgi:hypothetical protein
MRLAVVPITVASVLLLACAPGSLVDEQSDGQTTDHPPPTLEVTEPARASFSETESVVVRGYASAAAGLAEVRVNGQPAELAADGSFSITLEVPESITLIETVAIDQLGTQTVDARAVLAGNLVDQNTPVPEAMAAHVSEGAMAGLGEMVSTFANDTDWEALARSQNPIASSGDGCNQYRAHVTGVSHGAINVTTRAATGGIRVGVRINNLRVNGRVEWRALCVNGTTTFTITADAYEMGALVAPGFVRGAIEVNMENVTSQFHGFRLSADGIPGFVEDTFQSQARDRLANMVRDAIRNEVPAIAREFLSEFSNNQLAFELLGQPIHMEVRPTGMSWTQRGGTIVLESAAYAPGHGGGVYLASPKARPTPGSMGSDALEVAVADDAINQLLAAIWHSGVLEDTLLPDEASALGAILGREVGSATATMLLPPIVAFDGANDVSRITLGDVIIEAFDPGGESLITFALSTEIDITVGQRSDGGLRLRTGTSRVLAQVLDRASGVRATGPALSSVVELLVPQIGRQVQTLIDVIPIPGLPGGEIGSPAIQPFDGYLVAGGEIVFN